jgi:hypothetical protein
MVPDLKQYASGKERLCASIYQPMKMLGYSPPFLGKKRPRKNSEHVVNQKINGLSV